MPIDASISLGAQAPQQQMNSLNSLAQILQIIQGQQRNRLLESQIAHEEALRPLQMRKMEAEIANIGPQEQLRRAQLVDAQLKAGASASQMQGQNRLMELLNPQNAEQYTQGSQPNQMFATPDAARQALERANAQGIPFSGVAPNQGTLRGALIQADPKAAIAKLMGEVSPSGAQVGVQTPGSVLFNRATGAPIGTQLPFAPRTDPLVVVQTPTGAQYERRGDAVGKAAPTPASARAPAGYRFSSDGETLEAIPGGPKDKPTQLPTQALRLQQAEVDAIGTAAGIKSDLAAIEKQIDNKDLDLGLFSNLASEARNRTGISTEQSRNYQSFRATLEKLRNDSLRLNKGVQTEGDAIRAWNELVTSINDPKVVKQRLGEIQRINDRAIDLRKMNIDAIRSNYGVEPLDTSRQETQAPAVGGRTSGGEWSVVK